MSILKLYKQASHLLLCLVFLVEDGLHGEAQKAEAVIDIQLHSTSNYRITFILRNDSYSKFQENLFSNKNSTITFKYLDDGSGSYITTITASDDQNQKENLFYTCFINESIMALHCRRNISCTIQNCLLCNNGIGIRWMYNGYISSNYITNKTEHCDDGQAIVMYAIIDNVYSISTSTVSSTTPSHLSTLNLTKLSTIAILQENTSSETKCVKAELNLPSVVSVSVSVTVAVCTALFILMLVIWRKRKCKTVSNNSQNGIPQNYDNLQSAESIQGTDPRNYTYNTPIFSFKTTNFENNNSNNTNEHTIRLDRITERETTVHTTIMNDKITATLSAALDSEKLNAYNNVINDTRAQDRFSPSKCVAFKKDNVYDDIDHNQSNAKSKHPSMEINYANNGYNNIL